MSGVSFKRVSKVQSKGRQNRGTALLSDVNDNTKLLCLAAPLSMGTPDAQAAATGRAFSQATSQVD